MTSRRRSDVHQRGDTVHISVIGTALIHVTDETAGCFAVCMCQSFSDELILRPEHPKVTFHGAESILEVLDLVFPSLEANPQGSISQPRSTKRQPAAPSAAALDATPAARPGWGLVNAMKQLQAYLPFKF